MLRNLVIEIDFPDAFFENEKIDRLTLDMLSQQLCVFNGTKMFNLEFANVYVEEDSAAALDFLEELC